MIDASFHPVSSLELGLSSPDFVASTSSKQANKQRSVPDNYDHQFTMLNAKVCMVHWGTDGARLLMGFNCADHQTPKLKIRGRRWLLAAERHQGDRKSSSGGIESSLKGGRVMLQPRRQAPTSAYAVRITQHLRGTLALSDRNRQRPV